MAWLLGVPKYAWKIYETRANFDVAGKRSDAPNLKIPKNEE